MLSQVRILFCAAALLLVAAPLRAAEEGAAEVPVTTELGYPRAHPARPATLSGAGSASLEPVRQQVVGSALSVMPRQASSEYPQSKLASSIAAAGTVDILQRGTAIAKQAVLDCLNGDYPGGGMGLLSMPTARPTARTDHCRQ